MVPKLTDKQRRAALDKGMQIRLERARYKQRLKDGSKTVEQFFKLADSGYQAAYGMRVYSLLTSLPGYGEVRSRQLMNELRIAQGRKVKGLGTMQRAMLLSILIGGGDDA